MKMAMPPALQILTDLDTHYLLMLAFLLDSHPISLLPLQKLKSVLKGNQRTLVKIVTDNYYNSNLVTCDTGTRK